MWFSVKLGAGGKAWSIATGIVEGQIDSTDDHNNDTVQGIVDDCADEQCVRWARYPSLYLSKPEIGRCIVSAPGLPEKAGAEGALASPGGANSSLTTIRDPPSHRVRRTRQLCRPR
jgi:hypothetical protein